MALLMMIAQHQTEEISLGQVAKAVNMSAFYFCKTFRKVTGFTFIDYLAHLRVESVKIHLLDPHKRISEAAFEAGFQSARDPKYTVGPQRARVARGRARGASRRPVQLRMDR